MAKISPEYRAKRGSTKRVPATVQIHRTAEAKGFGFEACIRIGKHVAKGAGQIGSECAHGKNPRVALANALSKYSKYLKARKGAFRGSR